MEHFLNSLLIPKLVFDKRLKYLKYRGFNQSKYIAEFSCKFNKNNMEVLPNGKLSFKVYEKEAIKIGIVLADDLKNAYLCAYSFKSRNIDFLIILREYRFNGELIDLENHKKIEGFFEICFKQTSSYNNPKDIFCSLSKKILKKGYKPVPTMVTKREIYSVNDRFSIGLLVLAKFTCFDFDYIVENKLFNIYFDVFKSYYF